MRQRVKDKLANHLETYAPFDELEELHVKQLQQFLRESDNPYDRSNLLAHVVADAWIVNPTRDQVVLVEHSLNSWWMAPGGHCDGNTNVFSSALREAEEETGLTNLESQLDGAIFDINVGSVPTRNKDSKLEPVHLHFDICFAFEAPDNAQLTISEESNQIAWIPLSDIANLRFPPTHYRRPLKTTALLL